MLARIAADAVVLIHLGFVLFVALGGFLVLRWPRVAWGHIPCAIWGAVVELAGWICPLTPLEISLRLAAGAEGYSGGFVARYIVPLVYPDELTRELQLAVGAAVLALNGGLYAVVLLRRAGHREKRSP